jgi:hypothetical protein
MVVMTKFSLYPIPISNIYEKGLHKLKYHSLEVTVLINKLEKTLF